jgi:hypothetical protein
MPKFQKGQRANPTGRNQYSPAKEPGELTVKPSKLLRAMRWVAEHEEGSERTPLEKHCRALMNEDRKGFFGKLVDLEKAYYAAKQKATIADGVATSEEEEIDLGTEQVLRLLDELRDHATLRVELETLADALGLERARDLLEGELNRVGWPPEKKKELEKWRKQRSGQEDLGTIRELSDPPGSDPEVDEAYFRSVLES